MPSARDVDHTFSFPQPPFSPHQLGGGVKGEEEGEGEEVVSVGNPGCFQFNEFQFAATSGLILFYFDLIIILFLFLFLFYLCPFSLSQRIP